MPANRNALIRYKTIDNCLRNPYRLWTLDDLVEACSDALYEYEGIRKGISVRTVQMDIQLMRSEKLGYNAPIEVYNHKYYRYADSSYTITRLPLSVKDITALTSAIEVLRQFEVFDAFTEMAEVIGRLQDQVTIARQRMPIVDFERNNALTGLKFLTPLYDAIAHKQAIHIKYRSFRSRVVKDYLLFPYLLKEYRNRWFLFGSRAGDMKLFNWALDRVKEIEVMPDVPFCENSDFDTSTYFNDVIGVTKHEGTPVKTIRFWAENNQASYILTKPLHVSQQLVSKNSQDGSMIFEITVVLNPEVYALLMSFGASIKVLSPKITVDAMDGMFRQGAKRYAK